MSDRPVVRPCPECKSDMHAIKLIAKTPTVGEVHAFIAVYAEEEAQPQWFTRRFTPEGDVRAWLCDTCGRVVLYGEPKISEDTQSDG